MIFQLLLSASLAVILIYSYNQRIRSPSVSAVALVAAGAGLYFTWFPSHATSLAGLVGIGRGADLIFYLWVVISLALLLNVHLKLRAGHSQLTEVVRHIAILEGREELKKQGAEVPFRADQAEK
jgi:small membrane protein